MSSNTLSTVSYFSFSSRCYTCERSKTVENKKKKKQSAVDLCCYWRRATTQTDYSSASQIINCTFCIISTCALLSPDSALILTDLTVHSSSYLVKVFRTDLDRFFSKVKSYLTLSEWIRLTTHVRKRGTTLHTAIRGGN